MKMLPLINSLFDDENNLLPVKWSLKLYCLCSEYFFGQTSNKVDSSDNNKYVYSFKTFLLFPYAIL